MSMGCAASSKANEEVMYRNHPISSYDAGKSLKGSRTNHDVVVNISRRKGYRSRRVSRGSVLAAPMKVSAYSRALPNENDFRFIEQRVLDDSDSRKTESTTLSAADTNISTNTSDVHQKVAITQDVGIISRRRNHHAEKLQSLPPMVTAVNFAKRLEQLKQARFLRETQPAEEAQKTIRKESPRIEIVTHCPKEAFMESSFSSRDSLKSRTLRVRQNSIFKRSQSVPKEKQDSMNVGDDISETSFTVVHKTVKVAWEHEKYKERVEAERLKKELGLDDEPEVPVVRYDQDDFSLDDHISVMESDRCSTSHALTSRLPRIAESNASRTANTEHKSSNDEHKDTTVENM